MDRWRVRATLKRLSRCFIIWRAFLKKNFHQRLQFDLKLSSKCAKLKHGSSSEFQRLPYQLLSRKIWNKDFHHLLLSSAFANLKYILTIKKALSEQYASVVSYRAYRALRCFRIWCRKSKYLNLKMKKINDVIARESGSKKSYISILTRWVQFRIRRDMLRQSLNRATFYFHQRSIRGAFCSLRKMSKCRVNYKKVVPAARQLIQIYLSWQIMYKSLSTSWAIKERCRLACIYRARYLMTKGFKALMFCAKSRQRWE